VATSPRSKVFDKLPRNLRIGPYDWTVKLIADLKDETGEDVSGQCVCRDFVIELNTNKDIHPFPLTALETVLHEIYHAIFSVAHFQKGDTEERICAVLASYDTQIRRDNPGLVAWIACASRR
jgi:hypothetical protein